MTIKTNIECCGRAIHLPDYGYGVMRYCGPCGCEWWYDTSGGKIIAKSQVWKPTRDVQRWDVYRFEEGQAKQYPHIAAPVTLDQAQEIVKRAWNAFADPAKSPPVVEFTKAPTVSTGSRQLIRLAKRSHTQNIVIHEVAHAILAYWIATQGGKWPKHGAKFVRMEAILFEFFGLLEEREFVARALHAGLKVATREHMNIPTLTTTVNA